MQSARSAQTRLGEGKRPDEREDGIPQSEQRVHLQVAASVGTGVRTHALDAHVASSAQCAGKSNLPRKRAYPHTNKIVNAPRAISNETAFSTTSLSRLGYRSETRSRDATTASPLRAPVPPNCGSTGRAAYWLFRSTLMNSFSVSVCAPAIRMDEEG